MQFISSDSNIWLDFFVINRLETPFLMKDIYTFLVSRDTLEDEIVTPPDLGKMLTSYGLQQTELSNEEYLLAVKLKERYTRLSSYDTFALAIAKLRGIILLSGDGALRKAAIKEEVEVHGTIWIVDRLLEEGRIPDSDYRSILQELLNHSGKDRFLPSAEIKKRLER